MCVCVYLGDARAHDEGADGLGRDDLCVFYIYIYVIRYCYYMFYIYICICYSLLLLLMIIMDIIQYSILTK
jgi:hypothetical protein